MGRRRLFWRLFLVNLLAVLLFLAGSAMVLRFSLRETLRQDLADALALRTELIAPRALEATGPEEIRGLAEAADARITVIARDGAVLADSETDPSGLDNHAGRPEVAQALREGRGASMRTSATTGVEYLYHAAADPKTDQPVVRLAVPTRRLDAQAEPYWGAVLTASLILFCAGVLLSLLCAKLVSRPFEKLREAADRLAEGDADAALPEEADLAEFGASLQAMSRQLNRRIEETEGQRRELATIMENISDGLLLLDGEGVVLMANRAARKLLASTAGDLVGRPLWQTVRLPEIDSLLARLPALEAPERRRIHARTTALAGRVLDVVATPFFSVGNGDRRAVLLLGDATEDHRHEEMRRDFVANVSHELKTPLTSIKAYVDTLLEGADADEETRRPFLEKIQANTERLEGLVSDILQLSRLESGPREDARARADLGVIAGSAVDAFRERAEARRVSLTLHPPSGPAEGYVNAEDILEALGNLVSNAINYTDEGGRVDVRVSASGREIAIEVEDTGCGIPREALPRVFERFYRVDRARSRALGGTGLGLSIVKHIALRHGGRVEVESEVGRGSVFRILLPRL